MLIFERRGVSLLALSIGLVLMAIGLTVVIPRADLEVKRDKEELLRARLGEIKRAIDKFARCHNRQPTDLNELLVDAQGNRFLRQAYVDPMSGKFDWISELSENGQLLVRSASEELSISGARYCDFK